MLPGRGKRAPGAAVGALLGVASLATSGPARADAATEAAAQTLFDEAKALMQSKRFVDACPKLQQSQLLQPAGGTLLFLALCLEGEGKTASAWVGFNDVVSAARRDKRPDREKVATEHLATLVPQLTKLLIEVPLAVRESGVEVTRDGEVVASAVWGSAVPVDPGAHMVRATAPGKLPWESPVKVDAPGGTVKVTVPVLDAAPAVPPAPSQGAGDVGPAAEGAPAAVETGRTQRFAGIAVGAAGVAGLGLGVGFGVAALVEKGKEKGATAPSTSDTAFHEGNVSSLCLALGAAAVIGGGVLWLTAPKAVGQRKATWGLTPLVGARSGGVAWGGAW
jgi:serine/threonine-protein kinase